MFNFIIAQTQGALLAG